MTSSSGKQDSANRFRPDYGLRGRVAVITGGTGVLGSVMARGLAAAGAKVAVLGRNRQRAQGVVDAINGDGGCAVATPADVLDEAALERVKGEVLSRWQRIDVLVNAAGGNVKGATLAPGQSIFDLRLGAMREVMDLNFFGSMLPTTVFAAPMVEQGSGSIVNISSMAATRAITRVAGYSAAKAAIDNYTMWMSATLARDHGPGLRVNAIAPGFFLAEQNRALLMNEDGSLTTRGQAIIDQTPMARFGDPEDLLGALLWLCSDASRFVTGAVVPVDGGFSVFSGV
jgi:NAD(P)-dependent dehydrogenase (short-subunit alcohol dehydrogenase family)